MKNPQVKFTVEGYGDIIVELYPEKAPKTVENFLKLVGEGFYEGLIFHRVIQGFMIQGGGYNEKFEDKDADAIYGEFRANGFPQNDIHHARGVISMARTSVPNSASSQFFIMHNDAPYLDGQYAAFGEVIEGMDTVDKIAETATGRYSYFEDVPREAVVISKAVTLD